MNVAGSCFPGHFFFQQPVRRLLKRSSTLLALSACVCLSAAARAQSLDPPAAPAQLPYFIAAADSTSAPLAAATTLPDAPSAVAAASADPQSNGLNPIKPSEVPLEQQPHRAVEVRNLPSNFVQDGIHIFASPAYIRKRDLYWIAPLTAASVASFATDSYTMRNVVSRDTGFNRTAGDASDVLRDGLMGAPILMFAAGHLAHNDHARETGILATEAYVDAFVIDEVVKLVSFRQRPLVNNAEGDFFESNATVDSSFISGHAMLAWASAAAISQEYHHKKWLQAALYTAAAGVSVSRVMAQQHFPTDVLLGSAGGWLIGHYVVRAHHHADVEAAQ